MKTNLASLIASALVRPLSELKGQQIGWLRLVKPATNRNANYECAAWWQEEESETGIFPLILAEMPYNKGDFYAVAKVPARVTDCYFGALFCGNAIGKYDKTHDLKREATIFVRVNLPALVQTTGSATGDRDYAPNWEIVPSIIAHYRARGQDWLKSANRANAEVSARAAGETGLFDLGCVGSYAIWAGEHFKAGEEMARQLGYMTEQGDLWRDLFAKNYDWIPAQA